MSKLYQIIGPQFCGKSTLLRMLCPDALPARRFDSMFNGFLLKGQVFHFKEISPRGMVRLAHWVDSPEILINTQYKPSQTIISDKTFIYVGDRRLEFDCPNLVWDVAMVI